MVRTVKFQLEIELGNDEMTSAVNVANALRCVALQLEDRPTPLDGKRPIFDLNGNRVGHWKWPRY